MAEPVETPGGAQTGYEKKDLNVRMVLLVAVIIIIVLVIFVTWIDSLYQITREETIQTNVLAPQSDTLLNLRAHEDEVLNNYKLLDPATGKYQIPVDRAMELLAERAYQAQTTK